MNWTQPQSALVLAHLIPSMTLEGRDAPGFAEYGALPTSFRPLCLLQGMN